MASIVVAGDTSGTVTLAAPAVAGTTTLTLPTTNGTVLTNNSAAVGSNGITFSDGSTQAAAASPFGLKNRIINGDMVIDQRNAGASVTPTNGSFALDRWKFFVTQTSRLTCQQNAGSVTPPVGFGNYLGVTSSSAYSVGSTDYFCFNQPIEGFNTSDLAWGTANARTVTLSFWVRSSLTGTFGGALNNGAFNRSYPFSYTVSSANTWTQISITIPGDTTGTWVGSTNGIGLNVTFGLGSGSTNSGTAGSWASGFLVQPTGTVSVVGTNGATFYVTGVQLERNTTATPFEWIPYTTELQLCQRYFYLLNGAGMAAASTRSTTNCYSPVNFPVDMRTSPSATLLSTSIIAPGDVGYTVTSMNIFGGTTRTIRLETAIATASLTLGYAYFLQSGTASTNGISFNSEL